jgi:hypothetical protein
MIEVCSILLYYATHTQNSISIGQSNPTYSQDTDRVIVSSYDVAQFFECMMVKAEKEAHYGGSTGEISLSLLNFPLALLVMVLSVDHFPVDDSAESDFSIDGGKAQAGQVMRAGTSSSPLDCNPSTSYSLHWLIYAYYSLLSVFMLSSAFILSHVA